LAVAITMNLHGTMMRTPTLALVLLATAFVARPDSARAQELAQSRAATRTSECSYEACALTITPRWSGLVAEPANGGSPRANLSFIWPRDISAALRGPDGSAKGADSAVAYARRAVRLRTIGIALTHGSVLLAGVAGVRASRDGNRWDRGLVGLAGAAFVASVPLHFAADGALSRAVWWHNLRYAR
jgi:hypothetical protein